MKLLPQGIKSGISYKLPITVFLSQPPNRGSIIFFNVSDYWQDTPQIGHTMKPWVITSSHHGKIRKKWNFVTKAERFFFDLKILIVPYALCLRWILCVSTSRKIIIQIPRFPCAAAILLSFTSYLSNTKLQNLQLPWTLRIAGSLLTMWSVNGFLATQTYEPAFSGAATNSNFDVFCLAFPSRKLLTLYIIIVLIMKL